MTNMYIMMEVVLGTSLMLVGDQAGIFLGWVLRVQHPGPKWCGGVGVPSGVGNLENWPIRLLRG